MYMCRHALNDCGHVQGEMSATVMYYPESYIQLLTLLKDRVLQSKPSYNANNIQIGISTNFNKLCGCVLQVQHSSWKLFAT